MAAALAVRAGAVLCRRDDDASATRAGAGGNRVSGDRFDSSDARAARAGGSVGGSFEAGVGRDGGAQEAADAVSDGVVFGGGRGGGKINV